MHIFAADLHVETVGVFGVEAVFGIGPYGQSTPLQLGFHIGLVPVFDGVRHVVDARHGCIGATGVARQEERVAESEVTLTAIIVRDLHAQQVGVPIASLGIIFDLKGNVVYSDGLETFAFGCASGRGGSSGGRGHGEALNELTAIHFSLLEVVEQFRDEMFHCGSPLGDRESYDMLRVAPGGRIMRARICTAILFSALGFAQTKSPVDLEMLTWPELKAAIQSGKTTALVYNGGTETRGPQNVNGGHTLMAHATVLAIAEKLGNAIAAPVMPFSVNNANANLPGTIGLTGPVFASVNEQVSEQLIKNGFKIVVLMGDHGGGQKELGDTAKKLDDKYAAQGIHVYFCADVYKANDEFDKYLTAKNLPLSTHAGIPDTSEMIYLGQDKGWVRMDLVATAVGDPVRKPGEARDPNARRVNNGITGDARPSTAALGKTIFDMKVEAAVKQIRGFQSQAAGSAQQ